MQQDLVSRLREGGQEREAMKEATKREEPIRSGTRTHASQGDC